MFAHSFEWVSNPVQRVHCFLNAPALVRGSKHLEYVPPLRVPEDLRRRTATGFWHTV